MEGQKLKKKLHTGSWEITSVIENYLLKTVVTLFRVCLLKHWSEMKRVF
jgi:hypothetical protein